MPASATPLAIGSAQASDMSSAVKAVTISSLDTDGVEDQDETIWENFDAEKWFGIYKKIPEVKTAIDMRAIWTIGKGYKADPQETIILDHISGWGQDTFNSILKNLVVQKRIFGDAFAEIVRSDDGELINLKPLNPKDIKIVVDRNGIIKRYEHSSRFKKRKFKPNEILHLCNKRIADEIHGVSDIEAIEEIIKANNESFQDYRKVMHRYVKPMMKFELDTDDTSKIDALVTKFDNAVNKGENIYIPMGAVKQELIAVPANATLSPLSWREHLKNYFFQVVGIPQIVLGSSGEFTESTAKIAYLAFEQSVEDEQREIEEAIWNQLYLKIELSFPASLRNELISDEEKDSVQQRLGQPNEITAGAGR